MNNTNFNKYIFTSSKLNFKDTLGLFINRLCSVNHYYILQKKLDSQAGEVKTRGKVSLRIVNDDDLQYIIKSISTLDSVSRKDVISRLLFYKSGFTNCYAAVTSEGEVAYLQWLIYPSENALIENKYSRIFSPLREDQVMIENAFTFPKFRGMGLLSYVTNALLNIAKEAGYKSVVTYIRKDKIASLNEVFKMGFKITKLITEYKFLGVTKRLL
jgi:ribosomal protein S18 acetylase RimI-like enzyme